MPALIEHLIKNFEVVDCAVRSKDIFYIIASHIYEDPYDNDDDADASNLKPQSKGKTDAPVDTEVLPKAAIRIFVYFSEKAAEKRWGFQTIKNIEFMKGAASLHPRSQLVSVSLDGQVFLMGSGTSDFEARIPESKTGPLRGSVQRVFSIDGVVYVAQGNRGLCKRAGPNDWRSLCEGLPVASSWKARDEQGFKSADGFSEQDIYAGGGQGDLWQFDGAKWSQLSFPSNMQIETICCAGDGNVYVSCQFGALYRGRANSWTKIEEGNQTLPYRGMVWFQDKLWCTSDYGVWTLENGRIRKPNVPDEVFIKAGHISCNDGVLLLAGTNGAAVFDGKSWVEILSHR
jgi:hypothetical protein